MESLKQFFIHKYGQYDADSLKSDGQFNVFRIEDRMALGMTSPTFIRRDFYKIMLFNGDTVFHYGDRSIAVSGSTLLFFNPHVPYTYEPLQPGTTGFFCVFTSWFFNGSQGDGLFDLPVLSPGAYPVFSLSKDQADDVQLLFRKMVSEADSDFDYKFELIKSYIRELIYYGQKSQPTVKRAGNINAASRITSVFMELLERQFPIESVTQRFMLRSPKTVAERMSIHVNTLNRAIKQHTGKTTTEHLFERLTAEATILLKHTDWNISEISYVLGFEDQSHFNRFFKKRTHLSPTVMRKA